MAIDTLSAISSALSTTFAPQIVRAFNREAVLAKLLPVKDDGGQGDAKQVAWDVSFSGASAGTFTEGADVLVTDFAQDVDTTATLSWGLYRSSFALTNLEITAAARSIGNATALGQMVMHRLMGSITKLASVINADLWAGTGASNSIVGFVGSSFNGALISSGTYATLATGTYPEWASNVLTNGGATRPLTFALMSQLERTIYTNSGRRPNCIVTSPGVLSKYESLFETQKRYNSNEGGAVDRYVGSVQQGMEGMTTNLSWRDIPVYRDRNAPSGTLLMLDLENVEMKFLPFPAASDGVPQQAMNVPSSNGQASTPTPLMAHIYPLARTGDAQKFSVVIYMQLAVKRTNAQGALGDISET